MAAGFFLGGAAEGMQDAAKLGLADRAQALAEKGQAYGMHRDMLARADKQISDTMGLVGEATQALIDQGTPPATIAQKMQPLIESAKSIAAKADRDPSSLDAQLATLLARPPTPPQIKTQEGIVDKTNVLVNPARGTVTVPRTVEPQPAGATPGDFTPAEIAAANPGGVPPAPTSASGAPAGGSAGFPPSQNKVIQTLIKSGYTSQDVLDFKALRLNLGDNTVVNSLGRSKAGAAERKAIADRGAELAMYMEQHPEDLNARKAQTAAATQSLVQMTKMKNAIEQFSETAVKNGKVLVQLADKVDATGVPAIERWIRAGRQATGDPDVAVFNTQMNAYRAEVAKILTNPNVTGVLTDEARREVAQGLGNSASAAQIKAVTTLLEGDFARRSQSIDEQIAKINKSFGPSGSRPATGGSAVPAAPAAIPPPPPGSIMIR